MSFATYAFVYIDGQICVIFQFSNICIILDFSNICIVLDFSNICIIFEFLESDIVEHVDASHPAFVFYQCFKLIWFPNKQIVCHL